MTAEELFAYDDPFALFHVWMHDAEASEPNDPNAAALATATGEGRPSVRMVLVKRVDLRGFCFYTNAESEKGVQLAENPFASLCFHWKSLRRQVRVEGSVEPLDSATADEYFHSRSRGSQLGAAVSHQSQSLDSREQLEQKVREFDAAHPEAVPRPDWWRGYCIRPDRIEFWMDGRDRLHDRLLFTRQGESAWQKSRLYP